MSTVSPTQIRFGCVSGWSEKDTPQKERRRVGAQSVEHGGTLHPVWYIIGMELGWWGDAGRSLAPLSPRILGTLMNVAAFFCRLPGPVVTFVKCKTTKT